MLMKNLWIYYEARNEPSGLAIETRKRQSTFRTKMEEIFIFNISNVSIDCLVLASITALLLISLDWFYVSFVVFWLLQIV